MKKSIFTVAVLLLTFASAPAVAASYCQPVLGNCIAGSTKLSGSNCAATSHFCWGGYDVTSCTSCKSGYELSEIPLSSTKCTNTYQYNTCLRSGGGEGDGCGTSCDNCLAMSIWTNVSGNTGYQQQPTAQCDESTDCKCVRSYKYRCSAGYYGFRPSCMTLIGAGTECSGCSQCPDVPDKVDWVDESYSITSAPGSTLSTQCYIDGTASDHYIADETGHYTIVGGKCYYKRIF